MFFFLFIECHSTTDPGDINKLSENKVSLSRVDVGSFLLITLSKVFAQKDIQCYECKKCKHFKASKLSSSQKEI